MWRHRTSARTVAAACIAAVTVSACSTTHKSAVLTDQADRFGVCLSPTAGNPWSEIRSNPTEFGMDFLTVHGNKPVQLIAVEPVGGSGLQLTDVSFIPGGGTGNGGHYGNPNVLSFPDAWAARRDVPATLEPLTSRSSIVSGQWTRQPVWQAIIGVLPTGNSAGSITALRYTYRVGGKSFSLLGHASAGLNPVEGKGC